MRNAAEATIVMVARLVLMSHGSLSDDGIVLK